MAKKVIGNNQYGFNPSGLVLPDELPGGDGPNVKNIIQTPQTDDNGNITGGNGKITASNSIDNPDVYSYKSISGVNQTTGGSNISTTSFSNVSNTPSNAPTSNVSSGGFLPTGSSATGTGNNNMLNKKSIKKRMLTIPGQEQTTQEDIVGATEIIPQQSQATFEQYGVNRNAVNQVNADNKTGTGYNRIPLPGEIVKPTDTPTGDFQTDFQRQSQIEAKDAIQGGEFMNQQDKGIQEGGLAYIKNITDKYNEGLAKMQSDSDYEQKMFEMKAEDAKINHEADIAEIQKVAQEQIAQAEFMGARTGAGQASGYVQGVQNIAMDAQRTISRLNDSFARATASNKLTAKKNLEDYTLQLKQAKDDWNYQTRNISQQAEQNYNAVMQGAMEAGLDPAKIEKSLYNLASSVVESRNKALGSYIDNTRKVTDNINAQIEGASKLQEMSDRQRAQFTSIINANGGDAIAGLSNKSIDEYVQQGYLSPAEAVAYKTAGLQMAVSTLQKLGSTTTRDGKIVQQGIVSSEDVKKIQEYVDQGFTYAEAVATVASEDPTRFNKAPIEQPLSAIDRVKLAQARQDLNKNAPAGQAGTTAIDTIKKWEGFRENAYQDSVGKWTIGYGFTNVDGKPVQPGMTMDRGTADALLQQEINQRQNYMNYITVPLSDSQKAALSSFEFNLGSGIWTKDAMPILDKINKGDMQGAGELMKQYNKGRINGVLTPIQGLSNRRNEEARLLLDKETTSGKPFTDAQERQFKSYNGNSIPEEYKTPAQKQSFLDNYSKWQQANPTILNKEERAEVNKVIDNLTQDPSYKAYQTIRSKKISFDGIVKRLGDGTATPQDKQAFISDFAKVLDPTSVVREGEYALAAQYSQSKLAKIKQEAINFFTAGGPLSNDAALLLSKGLATQYDSLGQAHDEAIQSKLNGLKYLIQKDIPVEALQTSYSHAKNVTPQMQSTNTQKRTIQAKAPR